MLGRFIRIIFLTTFCFSSLAEEFSLDETSKMLSDINSNFTNDSPNLESDQVIVIIGKIPRPISDVFGAASVISSETIDRQLAQNISDLVRYQAGINIENSGSRFGYSGFSIRGIGGNRVATEIDGIPVADQFAIGSYSNSGRNFTDVDLVEQVEILRGPASSIYGSNAIGGVISFVTKKPNDLLANSQDNYYIGLKAGYHGVDDSRNITVNSAFASGKSSVLFSVSKSRGHEFDSQSSSGMPVDHKDKVSNSILAKYVFDISDSQRLSLNLDGYSKESDTKIESLLGQGRFRNTTALLGDDESKRKSFSINYDFETELAWFQGGVLRLYNQVSETEQLTNEARFSRGTNYQNERKFYYEQNIKGLRLNLHAVSEFWGVSHRIGYGLEYSNRKVTELRDGLQLNLDSGIATNNILSEEFPLRDFPISRIKEIGFYLNDEIKIPGTSVSIIPAIRYDQYQLSPLTDSIYLEDNPETSVVGIRENNFSPKFGLQQEINSMARWFVQYYEGYRAPPFEDANIGLDISMFNIRAIPNPELKSETTQGVELGYRLRSNRHHLNAIGFLTHYRDFIQSKVNLGFDPISERVLFQSQNIDRAKIYGSEIEYSFKTNNWIGEGDVIKSHANLFWSKGINKESGSPLNNIEPNHLLLGVNWQSPTLDWSVSLNASLYAKKKDLDELDDPEQVLFRAPGYGKLDLIVNYQFSKDISLSSAIYNLTDQRYWRWSDVNGLATDDPLIDTLVASGINAAVQLRVAW